MSIENTPRFKRLQDALAAIEKLRLSERMQQTALEYLLNSDIATSSKADNPPQPSSSIDVTSAQSSSLRDFMTEMGSEAAISVIPCLMYWAMKHENITLFNENKLSELYRLSGRKPPKNIKKTMQHLCAANYGRAKSVGNGEIELTKVGEDYVLHDAKKIE